jgi:thiol peroxidase
MDQRTVTMRGAVLPVLGNELQVGEIAPDFKLQQRSPEGLKDVTLQDYAGQTLILSVVPSLDTVVCEMQTKRFNDELSTLPAGITVLTVSMDLPFAQARFCSEKGTNRIQTASDHRDGNFGLAYGTLIEPLRLETRSVFIVAPDKTLKYVEYVPEVTDQPNYEAVLEVVREP